MSVQAMAWVFEQSESTLGARLVLLAIAGHADRDGGNSWASVKSLSEEARLSERQTRYALRKLEEIGEIAPMGVSARRTKVYSLVKMGADSAPTTGNEGAIHDSKRGQPTAPEPKTEPSKALERERDPAFDALARAGGKDPRALTRSEARTIGVKLAEIIDVEKARAAVDAEPEATASTLSRTQLASIIEGARERYVLRHPEWPITPAAIANHWSELVVVSPSPNTTAPVSETAELDPGPVVDDADAERMREAGEEWRRKHSAEGART